MEGRVEGSRDGLLGEEAGTLWPILSHLRSVPYCEERRPAPLLRCLEDLQAIDGDDGPVPNGLVPYRLTRPVPSHNAG